MKIQLKHSNVLDTGAAKQPTAPNMLDGEIAVNFNATDPAIFIKNSDGNIVRIAGKDNLSFTGYETSIQAAATPPSGLVAGNLYFDTDDNRLYYYYDNGTTQQWVDASTEKFDVTIIPDPTNLNHQSGTLDDRYVNSNGDTMTGNLVLNAGVNLNSSDVYLNNGKVVFEGANANAHEIRLTVVEPTADRVISLPDVTGTLVSTGDSGTVTSGMIADGTIQNSDVSNSAAIGLSKLATGALPSGITVASTNIVNGTIVDADINSSAAIALTKLGTGALPSGITIASSGISGGVSPTDIAGGALPNNVTVVSANIVDGSIVNADISNTASIQVSKLADGNSYQLLQTNAAGNGVEWTSNIDVPGTLDVTGISTFDDNLTVAGNLAVTGSTVSLDANIVTVKDGNIQLGVVSTPTDVTADGGGITLKGSTDKTLSWINSTDAWTSSEHFNLATGKAYYVNGSEVLNGSSLGSSVTGSSLTGLGTISSGVWQGTQIVDTYLATITGTGKVANSATSATNLNSGNAIVSRDGSGDFTARNVTAALIGNASTASALENARTIALTGDLTGSASFDGSSNISISTTATFTGTTNLTYNSTTRKVESDTGTDATIPLFSNTVAGLAGASGGGTVNYLRADGSWASPPGTATNLGYTAATSTITSSTGTGVAIPNFSSTNAGFVQGSGGGTTKFLRADGNWIALGSSSTSISTSPPSNPNAGDSWFDTDEGRTYIYYQDTDSSQWVESNPSWNGGIPTGSVTPGYLSTGGPNWDASGNLSATGSITAASGVISGSLTQGGNNVVTVGDTGTVTSTMILDGTIVNTDISSAAAIALNKLASGALPSAITIGSSNIVNGTIVDADISTSAAISLSKLSSGALPSNITVTSSNISDLSIVNTDVNASAAIAGTKISPDFGSQNVVTTGSLGIGTSSPSDNGSDTMLAVKRNASGQSASIAIHAASNAASLIRFADGTSTAAERNAGSLRVDHNNGSMQFSLQDSEKLRIDSSGRLLAGTSSTSATCTSVFAGRSDGANDPVLRLEVNSTAPANGTALGGLNFASSGLSGFQAGARIAAVRDGGTWTNGSSHPTYLEFATTADGASSPTERLRIDSSGAATFSAYIDVGTFNTSQSNVGGSRVQGGIVKIQRPGTTAAGASALEFWKGTTNTAKITADGGATLADYISIHHASTTTGSGRGIKFITDGGVVGRTRGQIDISQTSGNGGDLLFSTTADGASSSTERLRIDSSGRMGLGTSSPEGVLSVYGTAAEPPTSGTTSNSLIELSSSLGNRLNFGLNTATGNYGAYIQASDNNLAVNYPLHLQPNGGNVGIGTTSPTSQYGTNLNINDAGSSALHLTTDNSGTSNSDGFHIINSSGIAYLWNRENTDTVFGTNNAERMRIDSSGVIKHTGLTGAGGANKVARYVVPSHNTNEEDVMVFQVENEGSFNQITFGGGTSSYNAATQILFRTASAVDTVTGSERMRIKSTGHVNIGTTIDGYAFYADTLTIADAGHCGMTIRSGTTSTGSIYFADATSGTGEYAGYIDYNHNGDYMRFSAGASERLRIDSSGSFFNFSAGHGIYTQTTFGAGTFKYLYRGANTSGSNIVFNVWSNGNVESATNSYGGISDVKLKENIVDANSQWDDLKAIQVRNYNFKESTGQQTHTQLGVVAQEVETVSPGLVNESPDTDDEGNDLGTTTKSVNYSVLYMKAVKALQEAMERIETLEQRLSDAGIA